MGKYNPVKWLYYKVWQGYLNEATAAPTLYIALA
jgi:hypothetical protein